MRRLIAVVAVLVGLLVPAAAAQAGYLHEWYAAAATRDWDAYQWPGSVVTSAHCTRAPAPYSANSVSCYETRTQSGIVCNFSGLWTGADYYVTGPQSWTCSNGGRGYVLRAY